MKLLFSFLLIISFFRCQSAIAGNLEVVVVGGGPAGLATAIEAHTQGASVTVIEKRELRSRFQTLFLFDSSLDLLEKWLVLPTEMKAIKLPDNTKVGLVSINNLEMAFEKRIQELGIKKITGEFIGFQGEDTKAIQIEREGKVFTLPYDILVGADGAHSLVRNKIDVQSNRMGEVQAINAMISLPESLGAFDISDPISIKGFFIRKITIPSKSIIFAQRIPATSNAQKSVSEQTLEELARDCNWLLEAKMLEENRADIANFTVLLQQAVTFSHQQKGTILVGDAAAVASFFQGMSANTALKTASIAGEFFMKLQQQNVDAYSFFNQEMNIATDELIQDSKFLFCSN